MCIRDRLQHLEKYLFRYPVCVWKPAPAEVSTQSVSAGMVVQECAETGGQERSAAQNTASGLPPVQLRLLEASTLREEVRQICIAIRRLVTQQNYCYREIAVICGDYTSYASCIEQEFAAFGIPVYLDQTRGVTLNPFIEYIKSALQVRVKNYSYESVFHYLRSGLADFAPEETDRLEVYVRALGIRGRKKWETLFVYPTENMLDAKAELAQLNALRERLVLGLAPLYGKYKTTKEYAQGLYEFIAQSKIQQKLKNWGYYTGSVDGIFGPQTTAAVRLFQERNGLAAVSYTHLSAEAPASPAALCGPAAGWYTPRRTRCTGPRALRRGSRCRLRRRRWPA